MLNVKQLRALFSTAGQRRRIRRPGGTAVLHRDAREIASHIRPERILMLRVDGLGDFVLSLPAFRYLRSCFPRASLEVLVSPWNAELARMTGLFDAVHVFSFLGDDGQGKELSQRQLRSSLEVLQLGSFDIVVDMRDFGSKRWIAPAVTARFRAGFHLDGAERSIDLLMPDFDEAPAGSRLHAVDRLMMLAVGVTEAFAIRPASKDTSDLAVYRRGSGRRRAAEETYIVINPFSGRAIKNWPVKHYTALIEALQKRPRTRVAVFGSESRMVSESGKAGPEARHALASIPGVIDLGAYLPMEALLDHLAAADLYIGNDSGTTHLAAELGVPTIAIMSGDVEPQIWRPLGPSVAVLKSDVPCAPCYLSKIDRCPIGHACMMTILPESVLAACGDFLARQPVKADLAAAVSAARH